MRVESMGRGAAANAGHTLPIDGRRRVVVEDVQPRVDAGTHPVKRIQGDRLVVEADVFSDGHDALNAMLQWRHVDDATWQEAEMEALPNDRWRASFALERLGLYEYRIEAWVDRYRTWARDLRKRVEARQDVTLDLRIGARLVREALEDATPEDRPAIERWSHLLENRAHGDDAAKVALGPEMRNVMHRYPDRRHPAVTPHPYRVRVDPVRARASAWYEVFPRSLGAKGKHGTLRDLKAHLPYIAEMGFDVVYLPPIHPIGRSHRKGRNNATTAAAEDVGSPWAIGSSDGGHKAIHPALGTMDDFERLVRTARDEHGLDIALDIALQCSPDHPYVREHPKWFRHRPDGTIQYAENPPKKYEDIVPIDFETDDWEALWHEIRSVFDYWIDRGVRIFRVDNPHTKPFEFWQWLIDGVKRQHPDVLFLSEAFTRPKIMYRLAKLGFTHSYTYFAWRNDRHEIEQYFQELQAWPVREFFRPHLWPNTPDILNAYLQAGGRPAFAVRVTLAATLAANYGIYGPAFELAAATPRERDSEEYRDSEKYEIKVWDRDDPHTLRPLIARLNEIRRANPALLQDGNLHFHHAENDSILLYSRRTPDAANVLLMAVNLNPRRAEMAWTDLDLAALGMSGNAPFVVRDLLGGEAYTWTGRRNFIKLDPAIAAGHIFLVEPARGKA